MNIARNIWEKKLSRNRQCLPPDHNPRSVYPGGGRGERYENKEIIG